MLHIQRPEVLRVIRGAAIAFAATVLIAPLALMPATAHALTSEDLEGVGIETRVTYAMRIKGPRGVFTPQMTMVMKFAVKDGVVVGTVTRSSHGPRGPITRTNNMRAPIGVAGKPPTGGDALWTIQDDKLVLLRAFTSGGFKAEISFLGHGRDMACTIRAPFVREEGKGPIQTQALAGGGQVTILEAVQKSADCKVLRPPDKSPQ